MIIEFTSSFPKEWDYLEPLYNKIAALAFEELKRDSLYEIDVSLVDNETIQAINKEYRSIDKVTDVISFAYEADAPDGLTIEEGFEPLLGEIIISLPRALEQAKEIGNTPGRELSFLFVHGLLHLLGYDHIEEKDRAEMFKLQDRILDKLGGNYGSEETH